MMFRPHRGWLADAMAEAVEVDGHDGLIAHLRATHPEFGPPFDPATVSLTPYGDDDRIGWRDVSLVSITGHVVGFVGTVA